MKKIIDQWTDRTDLKPSAKWRRRHPEQANAARDKWMAEHPERCRATQRAWRLRNSEKVDAYNKDRNRKNTIEKSNRFIAARSNQVLNKERGYGKGKHAEITDLIKRGKDLGRIAVWLTVPMSVVNKIAEELRTTT